MWMKHRAVHRLYARFPRLRRIAMDMMAKIEMAGLGGHKDRAVLNAIRSARRERESLLSANEAFHLYSVARAQAGLPGVMAEVGVYQGCSAKIISLASGGKPLYLFDTFEGLPPPGRSEAGHLAKNQYSGALPNVQTFLRDHDNIVFYPGFFPQSTEGLAEERFSFVHLDVDLKSSTRAGLDYFYPRMVPGGIIMTHDYSYLDGVRDAFTEFAQDHGATVIELSTSQALVIAHGPNAVVPSIVSEPAIHIPAIA